MSSKKHIRSIRFAANRLKKAKDTIAQKHKENNEDEPDSLVSGILDEVELKRREKGLDND